MALAFSSPFPRKRGIQGSSETATLAPRFRGGSELRLEFKTTTSRCSNRLQESFDLGRGADRLTRQLFIDALGETGQHLAAAELDQLMHALFFHRENAFAPAHQAG